MPEGASHLIVKTLCPNPREGQAHRLGRGYPAFKPVFISMPIRAHLRLRSKEINFNFFRRRCSNQLLLYANELQPLKCSGFDRNVQLHGKTVRQLGFHGVKGGFG